MAGRRSVEQFTELPFEDENGLEEVNREVRPLFDRYLFKRLVTVTISTLLNDKARVRNVS